MIKECWYISDALHTSYTDVLDISVAQRKELIHLIREQRDAQSKAMQQSAAKYKQPTK